MRKAPTAGIAGVLLCAMLALSAPPAASAANTCPGRNGTIAVAVYSYAEGSTIGIVGLDGQIDPLFEPLKEIGGFSAPSFSCDGSQIVYGGRVNIEYCCNFIEIAAVPSGQKLHWLGERDSTFPVKPFPTPPSPSNPSYLSDGQITFDSASLERSGTYVVGPHGEDVHRLFTRQPRTSTANGRWFVGEGPPDDHEHLWLLNEKGNPVNRITAAPASQRPSKFGAYLDPSFSPDGRWIVYCKETWVHLGPQRDDLYLVRRDGTHERRLTHDGVSCEPAFSPDGGQIVFIYGELEEETNVAVIPLKDPGKVRLLTHVGPEVHVSSPTWAPR